MIFKFMIRGGRYHKRVKPQFTGYWDRLLVGKGTASTKIVVPC